MEYEFGQDSTRNESNKTLGVIFRVRRECVYPQPAKDVSQVRLGIMQCEEIWKATMSERGGNVKIPDL